jgi:hypothetical protein
MVSEMLNGMALSNNFVAVLLLIGLQKNSKLGEVVLLILGVCHRLRFIDRQVPIHQLLEASSHDKSSSNLSADL